MVNTKDSAQIVRLTIELPLELRQKLKVQSAIDGVNMRDAVIKLIEAYVEKKGKKS